MQVARPQPRLFQYQREQRRLPAAHEARHGRRRSGKVGCSAGHPSAAPRDVRLDHQHVERQHCQLPALTAPMRPQQQQQPHRHLTVQKSPPLQEQQQPQPHRHLQALIVPRRQQLQQAYCHLTVLKHPQHQQQQQQRQRHRHLTVLKRPLQQEQQQPRRRLTVLKHP